MVMFFSYAFRRTHWHDTHFGDHMFIKHSQLSLVRGRRSLQRAQCAQCAMFALILSAALPSLALG